MASERSGASGLAGRYATALFELADERKELDQTAQDLTALRTMLQESADLSRLIRSPVISREEQGRAIAALAERAGFSELIRKFLGLLAANRRLFALSGIITAYLAELARRRGEQVAQVTTARPLSDAQRDAVLEALRRSTGSKVNIETRVDPSLIGGMIVKLGSRLIDSSLRTKLERLEHAMKGAA